MGIEGQGGLLHKLGDRRSGRLKLLQKLGERPQILGVSVAQCIGVNQGVLLRSGLVLFGFLPYHIFDGTVLFLIACKGMIQKACLYRQ